jgi:DNA-binding MarR family transcriptional regulator
MRRPQWREIRTCYEFLPARYTVCMLLLKKLPKFETMRECAQRYPELDPTALQTSLVLLRVASDLIAAMDSELAGHGTSQGRFTILMLLENCSKPELSPSDLAEMSGVSRASISGLIDGLEEAGMVKRRADRRDRRALSVRLTKKGKRFLEKMLPAHFTFMARVMQNLSERERQQLISLVSKIDPNVRA